MKKEFEIIQDNFPDLSSCMCFVKLIKGKKYPMPKVRVWFNKLVDKTDYDRMDKNDLMKFLSRVNLGKEG